MASSFPWNNSTASIHRVHGNANRKQACYTCRQRKRKCHGEEGGCSTCRKSHVICVYPTDIPVLNHVAVSTSGCPPLPPGNAYADFLMEAPTMATSTPTMEALFTQGLMPSTEPNWSAEPGPIFSEGIDSSTLPLQLHQSSSGPFGSFGNPNQRQQHEYLNSLVPSLSDSMSDVTYPPYTKSSQSHPSQDLSTQLYDCAQGLPPLDQILELCASFFDRQHFLLPCLHKLSFFERLRSDSGLPSRSPLLWAVLAVAAASHPSKKLQSQCELWMEEAICIFNRNIASTPDPTQMLQAAVWLVYAYYIRGDLNSAWLMQVKACQMVSMLGLNRIDCSRPRRRITSAPWSRNRLEIEEQRRTVWCLFVLDRLFCTTTGFTLSLDDRNFQVNFPIKDYVFQAAQNSSDLPSESPDVFTMDISTLFSWTAAPSLVTDIHFGHIIKVVVILGRIISFYNHLHMPSLSSSYNEELTLLEGALDCIQGLISHDPCGDSLDNPYRVWLFVLLQTCRILLHHPLDQEKQLTFRAASENQMSAIGFERCAESSRALVQMTQKLLSSRSESLMNPFMVASFYIGARILSISRACGKSLVEADNVRSLIEGVDRIGYRYQGVSLKYRRAVMRDLARDDKDLESMEVGSGNYLDAYCD